MCASNCSCNGQVITGDRRSISSGVELITGNTRKILVFAFAYSITDQNASFPQKLTSR